MKYLGLSLLLLLFLNGCALHIGSADLQPRDLETQEGTYLTQRFEILKGGAPFRFQGFAEFEKNRLAIVGLTPVGNRGFSAVYENGASHMDTMAFYRLPIKAETLLSSYQMIYASPTDLQNLGFTVTSSNGQRHLYRDNRLVAVVVYSSDKPFQGQASLSHISQQFRLVINTLAVEPL